MRFVDPRFLYRWRMSPSALGSGLSLLDSPAQDWDAKYSAHDTTSPLESQLIMAEKLVEGGTGARFVRPVRPHAVK